MYYNIFSNIFFIIGNCLFDAINCDDNDICTSDSCSNGQCINTHIDLCCEKDGDCPAVTDNICTVAKCDLASHQCKTFPVENCCTCNSDCNDNVNCTVDTCNIQTGLCRNERRVCNDNNMCTSDTCLEATGLCTFTDNSQTLCDDMNACTSDSCNAQTGKQRFIATLARLHQPQASSEATG